MHLTSILGEELLTRPNSLPSLFSPWAQLFSPFNFTQVAVAVTVTDTGMPTTGITTGTTAGTGITATGTITTGTITATKTGDTHTGTSTVVGLTPITTDTGARIIAPLVIGTKSKARASSQPVDRRYPEGSA